MASLDPWIKSPSFVMPSGLFTMDQLYRLKISDPQLFFPQACGIELNYCPSLDLSADNLSDSRHSRNSGQFTENKTTVSELHTDCLVISTSLVTTV